MKHTKAAASVSMELARKWKKVSAGLSALVAAMGLIATGIPTVSYAVPIVLNATEDSIILDGNNANNLFPGLLASELGTTGGGSIWLSILKFDLSALTGMTVNSATFQLTSIFNHNGGTFAHEVYSTSDDSWTEGTVTGTNRPLNSTLTLLDSTNISGTSQAYTWDVLAGVVGTDGLAGSGNLLTLLVRPELSQVGNVFGPHFNDLSSLSGFPRLLLDVDSSSTGPGTPVPEPATLALLVLGLAGIGFQRGYLAKIARMG